MGSHATTSEAEAEEELLDVVKWSSKTLGFLKSYVMTWGEWNEFLEFEPTRHGERRGHEHILHEGMIVTAEELNGVPGRLMAFFVGR